MTKHHALSRYHVWRGRRAHRGDFAGYCDSTGMPSRTLCDRPIIGWYHIELDLPPACKACEKAAKP